MRAKDPKTASKSRKKKERKAAVGDPRKKKPSKSSKKLDRKMRFRPDSREIIEVDPAKAEELLQMNTLPAQRPLRARHVEKLAERMRLGKFRTGELGFARLRRADAKFLVNGQHQLHAVIASGVTISCLVETFVCETSEAMASLYRQYDAHNKRSIGDVAEIEARALGLGWDKAVVKVVISAASLLNEIGDGREGPRVRLDIDEKTALLKGCIDGGQFVDDVVVHHANRSWKKTARHMMKAPVVAAMMKTSTKAREEAKKFWSNVLSGEGLTKDDHEFHLREMLKDIVIGAGRLKSDRPTMTAREAYCRCVLVWNQWREGKPPKRTKYTPDSPLPPIL